MREVGHTLVGGFYSVALGVPGIRLDMACCRCVVHLPLGVDVCVLVRLWTSLWLHCVRYATACCSCTMCPVCVTLCSARLGMGVMRLYILT